MANIRSIAAVLFIALSVCAQAQTGAADESSARKIQPKTFVKVNIVQEREVVVRGPYARFAQQYLGVVAPLSNRESYSIGDVSIEFVTEDVFGSAPAVNTAAESGNIAPLPNAGTAFPLVNVDRESSSDVSLEEMAAAAAGKLFTLRKRRFDLVTGEAGENVFGQGLAAAIEEMRRLEEEYLALFVGKTFTECTVKSFSVEPVKGTATSIICRFTDAAGILPETDLTGNPIVLEITSSPVPQGGISEAAGKTRNPVRIAYVSIPASAVAKVKSGNDVLASGRGQVYQLGEISEISLAQ